MWLKKHEAVAVWSLTSVFDTSNFSSSSVGAWVNFQRTSQAAPKVWLVFKVKYICLPVSSRSDPEGGQTVAAALCVLLLFSLVFFSFLYFLVSI